MLRWLLQCQIDPVWSISVSYCWQWCDSALFAVLIETAGLLLRSVRGNQTLERSECMNAANLCTTYYLVLLSSMLTPALRCGVYLFTCLCLTLCAFHRRSLCVISSWVDLWWNDYEWAAHLNFSCILVVTLPLLYHWSSPWPFPLLPICTFSGFFCLGFFFTFWYNLWLHILPQLFRVGQSFLNWF